MSPGSSPLARGLLDDAARAAHDARIIPARAGFTPLTRPDGRSGGDHPRSRGVYRNASQRRWVVLGSSPLARGLRLDMRQCGVCIGIIPARAGFTNSHAPTMSPSPDHPRSRGVYTCGSLESQR